MRYCARSSRARAFTLIELLVVISIIAVLAAMLLPAISMVRDSARSSRCQSNLHQIGLAVFSYENDTGFYPDVKVNNVTYWSDLIEPYVEATDDSVNSLANTLAKKGVLRSCPMWPYSSYYSGISTTNNVQAKEQIGYGMNKNCFLPSSFPAPQPIFNGNPYRTATSSSVTMPGTRVMIGDAAYYFLDGTQPAVYLDSTRHRGRTNHVFYDGHVATLIQAEVLRSLANPATL